MGNLVVENLTAVGTIIQIEVTQGGQIVLIIPVKIGRAPQNNSAPIPLAPDGYTVNVSVTDPSGKISQRTESVQIAPDEDYVLPIYT